MTRNQLVGIECYEDLLEKMNRTEVQSIGDVVAKAIESLRFSTAEATVMGSYRRQKQSSGDVDVLITFKDYVNSIPEGALQTLVDFLWNQGHIHSHLTFLSGMTSGGCTEGEGKKSSSLHKTSSAKSYMGVFYSPIHPGKRRRVDIKIYPLSQKAFATLYFTGSAQSNRSMRLYAKQRFGWKLTDRGLFDISSGKPVGIGDDSSTPITEKDIYKKLQLVYKDPPSRIFFDDVNPL